MIAYLDASVLLRLLLGQGEQLAEWSELSAGVTSSLTIVECLRTIDRLRVENQISEAEVVSRREATYRLSRRVETIEPSPAVMDRAAQPLPSVLGTLDAIHLASAAIWREWTRTELVMATHDRAMARAARAMGFPVLGA